MDGWVGGWIDGWMDGWVDGINKYFEVIYFLGYNAM
jgi:hypothetical protein